MRDGQRFRSGLLSIEVGPGAEGGTVRVRGELDLAGADLAREALAAAIGDGEGQVVVDLTGLSFIDSTGIAILVAAIAESDGRLRFIPSEAPAVARVLALTGVDARMPRAA